MVMHKAASSEMLRSPDAMPESKLRMVIAAIAATLLTLLWMVGSMLHALGCFAWLVVHTLVVGVVLFVRGIVSGLVVAYQETSERVDAARYDMAHALYDFYQPLYSVVGRMRGDPATFILKAFAVGICALLLFSIMTLISKIIAQSSTQLQEIFEGIWYIINPKR